MGDVNIRIRDDDSGPKKEKQLKMYSPSEEARKEEFLDVEMQKRRWKNRRRMAWTALVSMIFVTGVLLVVPIPDARLKVVSEPITWFFFAMASVIGAYMGFTTWATKK